MRHLPLILALAVVVATPAAAQDLPMRKPGLWEMKMVFEGRNLPAQQIRQCTDQSTDKLMHANFGGMAQDVWNPERYDRFRDERRRPFFDLLALVRPRPGMRVVDRLDLGRVGIAPDPKLIRCDMPVEVCFEKLTDQVSLPMFRPAGGTR